MRIALNVVDLGDHPVPPFIKEAAAMRQAEQVLMPEFVAWRHSPRIYPWRFNLHL
jgi:hypothetical protein